MPRIEPCRNCRGKTPLVFWREHDRLCEHCAEVSGAEAKPISETLAAAEQLRNGIEFIRNFLPTMEEAAKALTPKKEKLTYPRCDHCYSTELKTREFLGEQCMRCNCIMNLRKKC